ncbi:IPExxxVDY family protein [Sphingobacterium sp. SGL-16]|uniref:IPExxxVDY family protein n=1 Tax=Sphingobacterium sp. SGL-16 TaxID=2710883 RepID=UPI0013EBD7A8|nr:IPExxxVDY family protein [Sphingobacterium sp. SGL-16]NGM73920.1 IPExxxVDY family protein [Sphingobacterium sp. SGL-16]
MNKVTFKLDLDFDLELDFTLIGISSSLRDYRLCHFINKRTGLQFQFGKESPIDHNGNLKSKSQEELDYHIITEKNKNITITHHFPMYRYCCEHFEFEYYIINNKSLENGVLIPEIANFDYFMLIKHYIDTEDLNKLVDNLKSINEIMLVKEIEPTSLKSKENLIF